jgi:hypothetical protein
MKIPNAKYTVIVETKGVDLLQRECFVVRHAKDFDDLSDAQSYAQSCREKWLDPSTRVRIEEGEVTS